MPYDASKPLRLREPDLAAALAAIDAEMAAAGWTPRGLANLPAWDGLADSVARASAYAARFGTEGR